MRMMTRGKAALAGAMALGLTFVATPAMAAELGDEPVVDITNDTFEAGSWGDGVEFTVTEVPEEADGVVLTIASMGEFGGGVVDSADAESEGDGTWTGTVLPDGPGPVAPDQDGYPTYTANASYTYTEDGEEETVHGEAVELTIVEGASVTGPEEATVSELAVGVPLQFEGFASNDTLTGDITVWNPESGDQDVIGEFSVSLGEDGSGEGELTITGATAEDQFTVNAAGENSSVAHYITAIADSDDDDDQGGDDDQGEDDTPQDPRKPEQVDTGA